MRINAPFNRRMRPLLPMLARALAIMIVAISSSNALAAKDAPAHEVVLSAVAQPPYLGDSLPNNGYAGEVATEAFRRVGLRLHIEFYPSERAVQMARSGFVDGQLGVAANPVNEAVFAMSSSFPGGQLVLLQRKDAHINKPTTHADGAALLKELSGYRIGTSAAALVAPDWADVFHSENLVENDVKSLDTLISGRFNLVLIDKLTAGDLMSLERPQYIGMVDVFATLQKNDFRIGFSRQSARFARLKAEFDRGLAQMKADGTLDRIMFAHGLNSATYNEPGKTTITVGTVNSPAMHALQRLSSEYLKTHPEIRIVWRAMEEKVLRQRLLTDLAIGDGQYDVMTIGAYEAPIWLKNQWLVPLDHMSAHYDFDDVIKPVRDMLSYRSHLAALPFYAESSMTFYRKDLLEQAGLTMPPAPTFDDIRRIAAAIHAPEKGVYGVCLRGDPGWGANIALFGAMINSAGGRWFDERWNPTIDTPEWRLALVTYRDLLQHYGPPQPQEQDYVRNLQLFEGGHCGIWIDATVFAGMLLDPKQSTVVNKVGFTRAPVLKYAKGSQWLWCWGLAIPATSHVQGEAMKFIEWATSREYIELVGKHEGWVNLPPGTRKSTYQDPRYRHVAPFADDVLSAIEEADPNDASQKPRPYSGVQFVSIPEFVSIGNKVGQLVSDTLTDKITVDAALKIGQEDAELQMRKSGYLH
jgi:sorbitol/mannitol transport system substrate-binding protein